MLLIRLGLVLVLAFSSISKFLSPKSTEAAVKDLGVASRNAKAVALGLPVIEAMVAGLLAVTPTAALGATFASVLFAAFTFLIVANLARGNRPKCACFGSMSADRPIGKATVLRNVLLLAAAVAMTVAGHVDRSRCSLGCFDEQGLHLLRDALQVALVGFGLISIIIAVALARLVGSLTERVKALEERFGELPASTTRVLTVPTISRQDLDGVLEAEFSASGVSVRDLIPVGRETLLVFLSSSCGACRDLIEHLARIRRPDGLSILGLMDGASLLNVEWIRQVNHDLASSLGISRFPTGVVLDPARMDPPMILVGAREIRRFVMTRREGLNDELADSRVI